jgi:hypothetical protein
VFLNRDRPFRAPRHPAFRPRLERLEGRDTPSTTVLDVAPNPATVSQAVTLTATVTESGSDNLQPGRGGPSGTVKFLDGSATLMKVTVSLKAGTTTQGVAQLATSALGAGVHSLTAKYSGELDFSIPGIPMAGSSTSAPVTGVVNAPANPPQTDVTSRVSVGVRRGLSHSQQLVTVTNTSGEAIRGAALPGVREAA